MDYSGDGSEFFNGATNLSGLMQRGGTQALQYGGDEALFVKFEYKPMYMTSLSKKEGRPIYKTFPWMEIRAPGQKDTFTAFIKFASPEAEAQGIDTKGYLQRFPKQWQAFKNQNKQADIGTPLEQWPNPLLDVGRVAELKALNIRTVEQLAAASDIALQKVGMGSRELQKQAKTWMEVAKDSSELNKLASENQKLSDRLKMLEDQMRQVGVEPAAGTKRKGRPKGSKNKPKQHLEGVE